MCAVVWVFIYFTGFIVVSDAVLPHYIPASLGQQTRNCKELIESYFTLGFQYTEILAFLLIHHGIQLSLRQLKRILKKLGLSRRCNYSNIDDVISAIEFELNGSGCSVGYRQMHQRLRNDYKLVVNRELVRLALKILDPEGVECRSQHRLRRRLYYSKGPNYLWHLDGYDKIKPFGFAIHGAIDGYSRRIIWLEVASSNNNPQFIAHYFLDCIKRLQGIPRCIRGDCGTENTIVATIQRFLRHNDVDDFSGEKSFMYGRSTSNQRIEAWWSFLKKSQSGWWISFFKDMRDTGIYSDGNPVHVECLKFCFMSVIREELYRVATHWNVHRIRPSHNQESPAGRPDMLFFNPEIQNTHSYQFPLNADDLEVAEEICTDRPSVVGCSDEFLELATIIMEENNLNMPQNPVDAKALYMNLLFHIDNIN